MAGPVNKIEIRRKDGASLGRDLAVYIDGQDLLDIIEGAGSWPEKNDAMVNQKALVGAGKGAGELPILIGAHCAANQILSPEDIGLKAFVVHHADDIITWEIPAPLQLPDQDRGEPIILRFHAPQYLREVSGLTENPQ